MRRHHVLLVAGGVATLAVLFGTPLALRRLDFFRVRQVELLGVRYLSPDVVLAALQLAPDQSVFHDTDPVTERVLRVGGVMDAQVERRLPGTLRVLVTERIPMAFTPGPEGLVALDAQARPLPYQPTTSDVDLPIVARPDLALVGTLAVIRFAQPDLYQEVDWVEFDRRGGIGLTIGEQRILFTDVPSAEDVDAVRAVRQHLASVGREYQELDARFGGWVVVRGGA